MLNKNQIQDTGFSLLEVILYIAILSTLVFGVASFVNLVSTSRIKAQVISEVNQQAIQIAQVITRDIRNAKSIVLPSAGQIENSLLLIDSEDRQVEFVLVEGKIVVNRGAGAVELNNSRVYLSDLEFKNLSRSSTPDIIQIIFTLSYANNIQDELYNYSKNYVVTASLYK